MSDPLESVHLKLPYLAAAQAQKHVTHNDALRRIDVLLQLAVLDSALDDPPATPADGERYIVAVDSTGAWADHDGNIAAFVDGAWEFAVPEPGWLAYETAGARLLLFDDDAWHPAGGYLGAVDKFGINATADDTNRLAVRSPVVLFSGVEAADGGTGDIRFVVNKETDADTASLLFQSGWSGRAEAGLAGDADFVIKVSPDGAAWTEAVRIDKDTGLATILYDNAGSGLAATTVQDAIDEVAAGGGGGAVASVFGRTGAVSAAAGDYDASEVDNDSGVTGATVKDALDALATSVAGKQAGDSDLTALAGVSATGLLARTGSGTAAARTMTAGTGISVTNGDGVSGDPTVAIDAAVVPRLASINAFTAQQQFNSITDFDVPLSVKVTNNGSGGPQLALTHVTASPAAADSVGAFAWYGSDSAANVDFWGDLNVYVLDPASGSEDSEMVVRTVVAGSATNALRIANGVQIGAPTGGYKGTGTLNATAVYDDNTLLTCFALSQEFRATGKVDLAKWDALAPDIVIPETRLRHPLTEKVSAGMRPVAERDGTLVMREVFEERPVLALTPVFDADGNGVDAIRTPVLVEEVTPGQRIPRQHAVARLFQHMLDEGFDPRSPAAYVARLRADAALPGMPTEAEWQHNAAPQSELFMRLWLAAEMMALVVADHEDRIAAIETAQRAEN